MMCKKEVFGWSMYDFAETIFSALFVTVYFPLFITLKGGTPFHVGIVVSVAMLCAGLLVPFLGAVADQTQRKKRLLLIFTIICCGLTFQVGFFGLYAVMLLGLFALLAYHASLDMYDSLLVNVSTKENRGRVSGIGTAVGYAGAVFAITMAYIVGHFYGYETINGIKIIFGLTAVFYFGFALLLFAFVKEPGKTRIRIKHFKAAFFRVIHTIKSMKKFKSVWLFLLASILYVDGANTTIVFLYLYARNQIGLSLVQFFPMYIAMAVAAAVGSLIFGKLTDRFGHKRTLSCVLFLWIIIILLLYIKTTYITFMIVGMLGGALLGAIWTISRPLLIELAPETKVAELLGYQGLTEKFSGVIGPALYGAVATFIGFRQALLIVIILFLAGATCLYFVRE